MVEIAVLAAVLIAAKLFGLAARRLDQPAVLGELIAGVVLGGSGLALIPSSGNVHNIIALLAEVGVLVLLFEIGLGTDLRAMMHVGSQAVSVAVVGVILPFLFGFTLWYVWYADMIVAIFVGATLTATSVGITSRVLSDMQRLHSPEGQTILGAAIVDDVLGLIILAAISTLGVAGLPAIMRSSLVVVAFIAGVLLARTKRFSDIASLVKLPTRIFAPIFFVFVGSSVNMTLFNPTTVLVAAALLIVAVLGKMLSGLSVGKKGLNRVAIGAGMVPRGEVGLIFAHLGLEGGIITGAVFNALMLVVMLTTFIGPPLLKLAFTKDDTL